MKVKICPKCNTDFNCASPVVGCWCEQYGVSGEKLAYLRDNYRDCLCPACLAAFAENSNPSEILPTNKE